MRQQAKYLLGFISTIIWVFTTEFFCEDYDGNRRNPSDSWLENPQLKCRCLDNNFVICDSLPKPRCQDINGIFRKNMETWMNSSCVECACSNGTINCTQTIISITYGLYNVSVFPTCEGCTSQETQTFSACKAFSDCRDNLIGCESEGLYIRDIHLCNGIEECPDGSDEKGCENVDGSTRGADPVTIKEAQYYDTHL